LYWQQNGIALVLLVLVYCLMEAITPTIDYEPRGIVFALEKQKSAQENEVALLNSLPAHATVLGNLRAELSSLANGTPEQQVESLVNYARGLAASIGGKGIIISGEGGSDRVMMIEAFVLSY